MKALLFIGGEAPERMDELLEGSPFVCAADSGLITARRWGLVPSLIVGDMDSLEDAALLAGYPEENVLVSPREKDETDTEIGLRILAEKGYGETILIGGGGGRLDHLVAILSLLERPERPKAWLTANERIDVVETGLTFAANSGDTVSIFPLGCGKTRAESLGLKWRLDGLVWERGSFGISNEASAEMVRIKVLSGAVFVIRNLRRAQGKPFPA